MMSIVSNQLRELASLLTDNPSTETIHNVTLKMLSLADDLDKQHNTLPDLSLSQNIDNILDEIERDEKQNVLNDDALNEEEYNTLVKGLEDTLFDFTQYPLIADVFDRKLNRTTWTLLFHRPKNVAVKYDLPAPLAMNINDDELMKIYDAIPKHFTDDSDLDYIHEEQFEELAKWMIKYKTDPNNKQKQIYDRLYHAFICYAYWSTLDMTITNCRRQKKSLNDIVRFYSKYEKYIDVNGRSMHSGNTILHSCCGSIEYMVDWVLSLKGINDCIVDFMNKTPIDYAKEEGNWIMVNKIMFAAMGNKMKQKCNEQISKLNRNKGIVKQWFRFYKINNIDCDEYKSMLKMVESLKNLIKKRLPISDDMLLLCFNFEMKQNQNVPLKCSLWKCLYNTLNEILRIPLNRRNWLWFKQYIFNSSLWYQPVTVNPLKQKKEKAQEIIQFKNEINRISNEIDFRLKELMRIITVLNKTEKKVKAELAEANSALKSAQKVVSNINKKQLNEIKELKNPPKAVEMTLNAVATLMGKKIKTWKGMQKLLGSKDFIASILKFDTNKIDMKKRKKIERKYLSKDDFTFQRVNKVSKVAGCFVQWVTAQVKFSDLLYSVEPLTNEIKKLKEEMEQNQQDTVQFHDTQVTLQNKVKTYETEQKELQKKIVELQKKNTQNEQKERDKLLYDLLIEMVSKQLQAQRDYLRPYIDTLENKTDDEIKNDTDNKDDNSWENLKNYKEFIVTDNVEGLRQDECVESGTNHELLPFPIRALFNNNQLRKLNQRVKEFDCHNHWNVHGYLSKLILTAHSLNKTFHEAMCLIFNIHSQTGDNVNDGVVYHQGPVKRILRSQLKAETDYSHCSYPTTSKIVDFIRCCLVYKNAKDLLNGINKFMKAVDDGAKTKQQFPICTTDECRKLMQKYSVDVAPKKPFECSGCKKRYNTDKKEIIYCCQQHKYTSLCIQCGEQQLATKHCLKKVLRLKNMFLDNKRENSNVWDLYKYADIKMGVLMVYEGQSMIVEVQFLLDFMLKAKSLGHGLYEISRNSEFIFDVYKIMNIGNDGDNMNINIDNQLRKAVIKGNENELATIILNEAPINLLKTDETKQGLIHYAIDKGHKKILQLMLDTLQTDGTNNEFKSFINMKGEYGFTPLHICEQRQNVTLLKLLLSYNEIDVNIKDEIDGETVFYKAVNTVIWSPKRIQIFDILLNDNRCEWNITNKRNQTLFHAACQSNKNMQFIKKLWSTGYFKINHREGGKLKTALILACDNWGNGDLFGDGFVELIEFLLNIPKININAIDKDRRTAMDIAIYNRFKPIMNLLYNKKELDWNKGENKLAIACDQNIEICQLVLKYWPSIDVNGVNNNGESPMHIACSNKKIDMLKFILNLPQINVECIDKRGNTPWLIAIKGGWTQIEHIKLLFNRKDIDFYKTVKGQNALDIAIEDFDEKLIDWLKSNGFTPTNKK